jgi:hypothetical protein
MITNQSKIKRRAAIKKAGLILGYSVSGPALVGIMNGCTAKEMLDWQPLILTEAEISIVHAASSRIIPSGQTPGAADAGVTRFIDQMVAEYYLPEDQQRFQAGIEELTKLSEAVIAKPFGEGTTTEQDQLLSELVQSTRDELARGSGKGKPFFLMLKELTVLGFFSSEVGATQFLNFDDIPGGFRGCEPLESVGGKTWAT